MDTPLRLGLHSPLSPPWSEHLMGKLFHFALLCSYHYSLLGKLWRSRGEAGHSPGQFHELFLCSNRNRKLLNLQLFQKIPKSLNLLEYIVDQHCVGKGPPDTRIVIFIKYLFFFKYAPVWHQHSHWQYLGTCLSEWKSPVSHPGLSVCLGRLMFDIGGKTCCQKEHLFSRTANFRLPDS